MLPLSFCEQIFWNIVDHFFIFLVIIQLLNVQARSQYLDEITYRGSLGLGSRLSDWWKLSSYQCREALLLAPIPIVFAVEKSHNLRLFRQEVWSMESFSNFFWFQWKQVAQLMIFVFGCICRFWQSLVESHSATYDSFQRSSANLVNRWAILWYCVVVHIPILAYFTSNQAQFCHSLFVDRIPDFNMLELSTSNNT